MEISRAYFRSTKKLWVNVTTSAFLGITVQGFKSKKKFCLQSLYGLNLRNKRKSQEIWCAYRNI